MAKMCYNTFMEHEAPKIHDGVLGWIWRRVWKKRKELKNWIS